MSPSLFRRPHFRRLARWILAWLLALPALAGAAGLTPGSSFAADALIARERRIPLLVLYSRDNCSWCEMVRRNYLIPITNDPAAAQRVLIREVRIAGSATPLTDFAGRATTHAAFAAAAHVSLAPTLDFLDDRGNRLVEPIVGVRLPDFYGAHIDRAIEEALAKFRAETK